MANGSKTLMRDAAVGVMILGSVLLLGYMAARIGTVGGYRNGREIVMIFDDATGLIETAPVAASGVKVGTVIAIEFAEGGARVKARVKPDLRVFADARASVRMKSLLGEKFVGLDPGTEAAGPLPADGRVKTLPGGDIERMAAAFARAAEAVDPEDVKEIVHGLAVALSGADGVGATMPAAIREVGKDLHRLAASLESVSGQSGDLVKQIKPILAKLDDLSAKSGRTLDGMQPTLQKLPATLDHLDQVARRLEVVLAKADKIDAEDLTLELRKILSQEGIYVRMRPRRIKGQPAPEEEETAIKPTPTPPPGLDRKVP